MTASASTVGVSPGNPAGGLPWPPPPPMPARTRARTPRRATPHDPPVNALRWGVCFGVIVAAHAGAALALFYYLKPPPDSGFVAGAPVVMMDLPEMPAAAPVAPRDLPPGPEQAPAEEIPKPVEETKPPEEKVDVAPPDPEPPKPEQVQPQQPRDATAPPPVMAVPTEAPSTAGVELPQPPSPAELLRWESGLSAQISRVKRYPQTAADRNHRGTVKVAFRLDDEGRVLERSVVGSSGWPELDQEALEAIDRAQPFPKPPPGTSAKERSFVYAMIFAPPGKR
jgi:periplasmic protein TonB